MFATSPLAAMRSAPTTTRSTRPRAISAPCARVGHEPVRDGGPAELPGGEPGALEQGPGLAHPDLARRSCSHAGASTPAAVPKPAGGQRAGVAVRERAVAARRIARRPALRGGARPRRASRAQRSRRARPAPPPGRRPSRAPRRAPPAGDRAPTPGSRRSDGSTASSAAASSNAARTSSAQRSAPVGASATPYAAASPIAGAPRTASERIASATSPGRAQRSQRSSAGKRPLIEDQQRAGFVLERRSVHRRLPCPLPGSAAVARRARTSRAAGVPLPVS